MRFKPLLLALPVLAVLALPALRLPREGFTVVPQNRWTVSVVAGNASGFGAPDGLAWHAGQLYLADEGGHAIEVLAADGRVRRIVQRPNTSSPEDIVVDTDGTIYFSDDDLGGVSKIDPLGKFSTLAGPEAGLRSTEGIVLTPWNTILVGDGEVHRIFEVTKSGDVTVFANYVKKPESMVFDSLQRLYLADNEECVIYRIERDKPWRKLLTKRDGISKPESLAIHGDALYFTDPVEGRIHRYTDRDGLETLAVLGGQLQNVQGITVADDGTVYVSIQTDLKRLKGYVIKLQERVPSEVSSR